MARKKTPAVIVAGKSLQVIGNAKALSIEGRNVLDRGKTRVWPEKECRREKTRSQTAVVVHENRHSRSAGTADVSRGVSVDGR